MPLSLEQIGALLQKEKIRREKEREAAEKELLSAETPRQPRWIGPLDAAQRRKILERPLPPTLYTCPVSQPQTTLVPWNSLPLHAQTELAHLAPPSQSDDAKNMSTTSFVVEVPRRILAPPDIGDAAAGQATAASRFGTSTPQRPALRGNLRDKLTEYTRGVAGQARPFRPGGVDYDSGEAAGTTRDDAVSEEAVIRNRRVLEQDTATSWKEGLLLTAPPGVDFEVGLSWNDVHGCDESGETKQEEVDPEEKDVMPQETHEVYAQDTPLSLFSSTATRGGSTVPSLGVFTKGYFDDDSLFGSSSSSSESGSEGDDKEYEEEERVDENANKQAAAATSTPANIKVSGNDDDDDVGEDDIDGLLALLTLPGHAQEQSRNTVSAPNALVLAERQAHDQTNTARKTWANEVLLPIHDFHALIPNPAMTFPFALDDFQQQAVARLERSESVFVAAHTSAGKTVVAEYAVALAMQRSTRCIYTSPIKALSNQKFRDFSLKFGGKNVGLITGDLQVNADDSTCIIMTTEILRSMLYRGADLIRDIEYVIFDEVHYINDQERGVVWEEVIIMLPSYVNLIFLSATTPNTVEFSDWIGRTKRKPVHVIKTNYRPVPLSYHLWAGLKLHKILQGNGGFIEKGYAEAAQALLPASAKDPKKKNDPKARTSRPATGAKNMVWQAQGSKNDWMSLVRFLDRELLTPVVVFSFSKKKCEEIANMLRSLDLNTAKEKSAVQAFTLQAIARLSPSDAKLPQVNMVCEMVQRGIGVHHGGLLPILKECIEILFSRSLVKVLFATETFAMGVNMPARAVVFNGIRKHDGLQFRTLNPSETTQIAGRAGRRGLDTVGTVIITCFGEQPPPNQVLRQMLTGSSTKLSSQFRLTYNMILNLLRVEEMSVESMIKRSFSEFATQRHLAQNDFPNMLAKGTKALAKLERQLENETGARVGAEDIGIYFETCKRLLLGHQSVLNYIFDSDPAAYESIFVPGRLLLVTAARKYGVARAPAIVLRPLSSKTSSSGLTAKAGKTTLSKMVCLILQPPGYVTDDTPPPGAGQGKVGYVGTSCDRHYAIREVDHDEILLVSTSKLKVDAKSIFQEGVKAKAHPGLSSGGFPSFPSRDNSNPFAGMKIRGKKGADESLAPSSSSVDQSVLKAVDLLINAESEEVNGDGLPLLDLRGFLQRGSDALSYRSVCDEMEDLLLQARALVSHRCDSLERHYVSIEKREILAFKVESLKHALSNESLSLFPDFLQRKEVLRRLRYVDENEAVCVKGRVACEVNTCEELIATEIVFEGLLNDLQPEEIIAVLSALVYQEKSSDSELDDELPNSLVVCCEKVKTIATNLGQLQKDCGLDVDPKEYCEQSLKFGLVHVVYDWSLGVPFAGICELTDVQEGSIVRCITRLDELCREIRNCARVVGNPTLYRKCEAASASIKRDIVFASSLYVS